MTPAQPQPLQGLRVAILNWRDMWDSGAGGAELYAEQLARGLAAGGARVRLVTSRAPGQVRDEVLGGVSRHRRGSRWSSYLANPVWLVRHRRELDTVIDCQNGLAYCAPLFVGRQVSCVLLVHHVHQEQWGQHFPPLVAAAGRLVERVTVRWIYRNRTIVAVSRSTADQLVSRLGHRGPIEVAYNGSPEIVDVERPGPGQRPRRIVYVGRLARHKRVEDLVSAVPDLPDDVLVDIVGTGTQLADLRQTVERNHLQGRVAMRGWLPAEQRLAAIDRSVLQVQPSMGEGWGLTVVEAAARGLPSVVRPVPGLQESVIDGRTGWHVRSGESLADAISRALAELDRPGRAAEMAAACRAHAARFGWDDTVRRWAELLGRPPR